MSVSPALRSIPGFAVAVISAGLTTPRVMVALAASTRAQTTTSSAEDTTIR